MPMFVFQTGCTAAFNGGNQAVGRAQVYADGEAMLVGGGGFFAALAIVDLVRRHEKNYNAFVIACYCDPGLYAARELTNKPVFKFRDKL